MTRYPARLCSRGGKHCYLSTISCFFCALVPTFLWSFSASLFGHVVSCFLLFLTSSPQQQQQQKHLVPGMKIWIFIRDTSTYQTGDALAPLYTLYFRTYMLLCSRIQCLVPGTWCHAHQAAITVTPGAINAHTTTKPHELKPALDAGRVGWRA